MRGFWDSEEAEAIRLMHRRSRALRLALPLEPPTKKSRPGARKRARDALTDAFENDELIQYVRQRGRWPKPRAAIALDIDVFAAGPNGPRIDSICKWLLDELAGHVYTDDRQVKLLFARAWHPQPASPADMAMFWGDAAPPITHDTRDRPAMTYVTAQTRADVVADLRAAARLDECWDPFHEDRGSRYSDPVHASNHRDHLVEYRALFDPSDENDADEHRLLGHQIDYTDQVQQQRLADLILSTLLTRLPVDQFNLWGQVSDWVRYSPYIFHLGVLPERGGSEAFQQNLRQLLETRRAQFPGLFRMRATSGISMILFEDALTGKDLDNLVRTALPDVLTVLRPPRTDLPGWVATEPDPATGSVDIPFLEVAALPSRGTDMPAGSVIFGLSSGHRHQSWWDSVADHLEHALDPDKA
ncbi:RusA family crossover junction endodeoxyribonuclease [Microbacterium profundi]|uniref:RusA family crossover junction endodeoxyribonuclease n=1 Tax=Microbacterium profundi TaxID=450380 RepID=UPI001F2262B5|nr:RusA family crossover junction endodeoxyribonuclease [Microbacterium profundi]MCE7482003.1 RusA family crossover junction endodeoxyribonuclease [Microbacterium profundi]